ncbi:MAG: trigger factor [Gaiellaceae bacterium]
METNVVELAQDRVRLTVEVPSADIKHAVEHAGADLAERTKVPGFRAGKVPLPVLVRKLGKERIYTEAVESHVGGWLGAAVASKRLRPVSEPRFEYELPTSTDSAWSFSAEFDLQALPKLADWRKLEVGKAEVEIPDGLVEHELDVLRSSVAQLVPVEGRPVQEGDTLLVDFASEPDDESRDQVIELGAGKLTPELEQGLIGMEAGESREILFSLSDGSSSSVTVSVKEIMEKELPPLDDELARAASEFETLDELRADIEARLQGQAEEERDIAFREAAVDALVDASNVEVHPVLVEERARLLLANLVRSLERRGMNLDLYLQLTGQEAGQLVEQVRVEARRSIARELVLEAAADKSKLKVSDSEIEELVREQSGATGEDADELVAEIWSQGRQEELREDMRMSSALDRICEEVKPIPLAQAEAREQIWTPEKEKPASATKLWTPGSSEETP